MNRLLLPLVVAALMTGLALGGCASTAVSGQPGRESPAKKSGKHMQVRNLSDLSEREKWSMAREAFDQAQRERARKDNDAAAYFYGVTFELLGSLDMASLDLRAQRVLEFQRRVQKSYDQFLGSIESLPPTADPQTVLEAKPEGIADESEVDTSVVAAEDSVHFKPSLTHEALPPVPVTMNAYVEGQIRFFQGKGRGVMLRWMERSANVFPRLRPILIEEGIPEEVMYLAMIESGLNMEAYSYAHASGIWQFIPGTARIYGLRVDRVYDERRHVELATRAACRYLRTLYEQFGDWYLSMAAYNCGEGRIAREIRHSRTSDYWRMRRLPRQTRNYVPAYLAARAICERPGFYGFPSLPKERPFECERATIKGGYRIEDIAAAAGCDPVDARAMNPEFLKGVTPVTSDGVTVRLPTRPKGGFETRLAAMPMTEIQPTTVHRVRRGETLAVIAKRYGTTVRAITALPDNRRIRASRLRVGQEIVIPVPSMAAAKGVKSGASPSAEPVAPATMPASVSTRDKIIYTVHAGESLSQIARQLGVSVDQVCRENKISDPNLVTPGQKLTISGKSELLTQMSPEGRKVYHTVQSGDTIWSIAQSYQRDASDILSLNGLKASSKIYPGQRLVVGVE